MKNSTNTPYRKQINELGIVNNPITAANPYISYDKNRKQRRESLQKDRFHGESKNLHLTVSGQFKYERFKQYIGTLDLIRNKFNIIKTIFHYKLR